MTVIPYLIIVRKHPAWNPERIEAIKRNALVGAFRREGRFCPVPPCQDVSARAFLFGETMGRVKDLSGRQYGRLVVVSHKGFNSRRNAMWLCECECGQSAVVSSDCLQKGSTRSCGCYQIETTRARSITHGKKGSRAYSAWRSMRKRCEVPSSHNFARYGGRGIAVCDKWGAFEEFYRDMGDPPPGMSLDRINNDGGYAPGNCRWATPKMQSRNTSTNRVYEYQGKRMVLAGWAETTGISFAVLWSRLSKLGWSIDEALETDVGDTRASKGARE